MKQFFTLSALYLALCTAAWGQPTVNGAVSASEYGGAAYQNGNWYVTWDNTNLYLGIESSNVNEAAVFYLDANPIVPINGGSNSNGTLVGFTYDNTGFAELPFRADAVYYFKAGYREYCTANGSGGWSGPTTSYGTYADNLTNTREIAIPWSTVGGKPTSFAWYGYVAAGGTCGGPGNGYGYQNMPILNGGGVLGSCIGSSARYSYYYESNDSVTPFARMCYTANSASNISNFGDISVYNFTLNSSIMITRRTTVGAKNWNIAGDLVIAEGQINFNTNEGDGFGTTDISGNLVMRGGFINMNASTNRLNINGNLDWQTGGNISLSSAVGGDMDLKGNFTRAGTFTPNDRSVFFTGTGEQTISDNTTFDFVNVEKTAGEVKLLSSITVNKTLSLNASFNVADINLNGFNITLNGSSALLVEDRSNNKIVTDKTIGLTDTNPGGYISYNAASIPTVATANDITELGGLGLFVGKTNGSASPSISSIRRYHYSGGSLGLNKGIRVVYNVNGTATATDQVYLGMQYPSDAIPSGLTADKIFRYGTTWQSVDATAFGAGFRTTNPIVGFSSWTVGSEAQPLPVRWLSFTARKLSPSQVELRWQTATETNNLGFGIEYSGNGYDFAEIGFVAGAGNSLTLRQYNRVVEWDGKAAFFRLRQQNVNGTVEYSPVVRVAGEALWQAYPNPFTEHLTIDLPLGDTEQASLAVYNVQGQLLAQWQGDAKALTTAAKAYLYQQAPAMYLLHLRTATTSQQMRIVKQ